MEGIIMAAQLILGLSILVGIHEFGHYITAIYCGMRVEKFSIGFPPKLWSKQIGETEFSIGAIPLGGFVKIAGMVDESLDLEVLNKEAQPWEYRSKSAPQRLLVMLGGIIMNVLLGVTIFICMTFIKGETLLSKEELNKYGIEARMYGEQIGLQTGDKIIDINGKDYESFNDLLSSEVLLAENGFFTVERDNNKITVPIPNDILELLSNDQSRNEFISYRIPFKVAQIAPNSNAEIGGLKSGDEFLEIFGTPVKYYDEFVKAKDTLTNKVMNVTVKRNSSKVNLDLKVGEDGIIGFNIESLINFTTKNYGLFESINLGTYRAFNVVWLNIKGFKKIFSGDVSPTKSMTGPIGIAKYFGGEWDWDRFWTICGLLSMVLAFMNLLPIPALDGGHVMFLCWEIVTGKQPSDKFLEISQKIGMGILFALMAFVILNDIIKLF